MLLLIDLIFSIFNTSYFCMDFLFSESDSCSSAARFPGGQVLLGCDGIRSSVRNQLYPNEKANPTGYRLGWEGVHAELAEHGAWSKVSSWRGARSRASPTQGSRSANAAA